MTDPELKIMCETIEKVVRVTVNGKIDGIKEDIRQHNERHEADMVLVRDHIQEVQPYLQGAAGVRFLGNGLKWVAGVGTALFALWYAIKNI